MLKVQNQLFKSIEMKKILLLITAIAFSSSIFSQMHIEGLKFIFDQKSSFTSQFLEPNNSKEFTFTVEGINNSTDAQALEHMVSNARGVEEFSIQSTSVANKYNASIKVYKHANGWWYWKTFMLSVGIPYFKIEGTSYTAEQIKNLK